MNPRPISAEPMEDYELLVTFKNGEKRIFDVKPILSKPIYQPLRDKVLFNKVKTDAMCIYWNDEIDLCPDMVYTQSHVLINH